MLNVFPAKRAPRLNEHPFFYVVFITFPALFMDNLTYEARLGLAIDEIGKQATPNWLGTARRFQVDRETLKRRFNGTQQSIRLARSETHKCLSMAQEETLIGYINSLSDRSIPPTSQIVQNIAEELIGRPVSKNWTSRFISRHQDRLSSVYLCTIDNKRVKADSIPYLESFYSLVSLYITLYNLYINNSSYQRRLRNIISLLRISTIGMKKAS